MRDQASLDYADAAMGTASAALSACAAMTALSFECWSRTIEVWTPPNPERRSWYRKPANVGGDAFATWMDAFARPPWTESVWPSANPWSGLSASASPLALSAAWFEMFPLRGPPASWPLAFTMIANGVPRSVAVPAAEANVAVMEAANSAMKPLRRMAASYRGDSGHAMTVFAASPYAAFGALAADMARSAFPWVPVQSAPFGF